MFTDVNGFLNLQDDSFVGKLVGICEHKCDSSFLVHHFLSHLLKSNHSVVLLSFAQSLTHFNGVGNKIGNNLAAAKADGQFVFVEGLKCLASSVTTGIVNADSVWLDKGGKLCVRTLCHNLKSTVETASKKSMKGPVLIIDCINVLLDLGLTSTEVTNLVEHLYKSVSVKYGGGMIVGVNNDLGQEDEDADFVKKYLQHLSTMNIEVKGLETGYCKDVHGQLAVTWRESTSRDKWPFKSSQFKLTDKNCALFASGMSSAVL